MALIGASRPRQTSGSRGSGLASTTTSSTSGGTRTTTGPTTQTQPLTDPNQAPSTPPTGAPPAPRAPATTAPRAEPAQPVPAPIGGGSVQMDDILAAIYPQYLEQNAAIDNQILGYWNQISQLGTNYANSAAHQNTMAGFDRQLLDLQMRELGLRRNELPGARNVAEAGLRRALMSPEVAQKQLQALLVQNHNLGERRALLAGDINDDVEGVRHRAEIDERELRSQAIATGAHHAPMKAARLNDIRLESERQIRGIGREGRRGVLGLDEREADLEAAIARAQQGVLGADEEVARATQALNQVRNAETAIDIAAERLGISRGQLEAGLNESLRRLGIQEVQDIDALKDLIAKADTSRYGIAIAILEEALAMQGMGDEMLQYLGIGS